MRCKLCNAVLADGSSICPICGFDNTGDPTERELVSTHGVLPTPEAPVQPAPAAVAGEDKPSADIVPVPEPGLPAAERIPERAKKKRSPWPWIAGAAALLVVLAALAWWFVGRPLTSPQMKMGSQIASMFDGFFDMEGGEFLTRVTEDDHELKLTLSKAVSLPLPVSADIELTQAKQGGTEGVGASLLIDGVSYADVSLLLREELLGTVRYADVDAAFAAEVPGEPGEPLLRRLLAMRDCDPELKQKFLTETGMLLYKNTDEKQFAVDTVGTYYRVSATFTADDLLKLAEAFDEKLAEAAYRAMAVEVLGGDTVDKLAALLDMAPTLLNTASDLTVTIESVVREDGGEQLNVAIDLPGTFTLDAKLLRLCKDGVTSYELTLGDALYSANFSFPSDGVIDIWGMAGASPYTLKLDTAETQSGVYTGALTATLDNGILTAGDAVIDFNAGQPALLAGYDGIAAAAKSSTGAAALLGDLLAAADFGRLLTLM